MNTQLRAESFGEFGIVATVEFDDRPFCQRDIDDLIKDLREEFGEEPSDAEVMRELIKWALDGIGRVSVTYKGETHRITSY